MKIAEKSPDALADWFENSSPEDYDEVLEGEALRALDRAVAARQAAETQIVEAVKIARAQGVTWSGIGGILGMSRQGAYQKYASAVV